MRHIDRAWRQGPAESLLLASVYARLLVLEERDASAAMRLLRRANESSPDPDLAALIARTALLLQGFDPAAQELQQALQSYSLVGGELLEAVAIELLAHSPDRFSGCIGIGPSLQLLGVLQPDENTSSLEVETAGGAQFSLPIRTTMQQGRHAFALRLPESLQHESFAVSNHGRPLLGGHCGIPAGFMLDGRATYAAGVLIGWARIGWLPSQPVSLRISDEDGNESLTQIRTRAQGEHRWPFRIDLRQTKLSGERIVVAAQLPDGRWQSLPDAPLWLPAAVQQGPRPRRLSPWSRSDSARELRREPQHRARLCDVIIPVHGAREQTLACIDSVSRTTTASIVVIDDASDDPMLGADLARLAQAGTIQLLRNESNLGFAATVNRGVALHPKRDAVILNSDTQVYGDWLDRLRRCAYAEPHIGTVTPFSNNGSIATYPRGTRRQVLPAEAASLNALASQMHAGVSVDIPVGVGFCLYLRRDCLKDTGTFDATLFDRGYGEETDYCMRARARGWSHRLAADVFVYHAGGHSFGARRAALLDRGQRLINLRYPGYDQHIAAFLVHDPLQALRRRLDEQQLLCTPGRFVLLVTLALAGGVDRFVAERCRAIRERGLYPLVLRPAATTDRKRCELWTDSIELPDLRYRVPAELEMLRTLLHKLPIASVEIQHFMHLDERVIETVRALQLPYEAFIHDYAWICPRVNLIDSSGAYCGEPAVAKCESCVRRLGSELGDRLSVTELRTRSATWLRAAQRVIAPSSDTAIRMHRYFPGLQIEVRSNTAPALKSVQAPQVAAGRALRVALLGAIGSHKGSRVLLECARDARDRALPLEFVVIGFTDDDQVLLRTGKVSVSGRYGEGEVAHLLAREQPDVIWMASVWPETWCYTLDYALQAGLPVVAFDLGAIAERLRAARRGTLLPLNMSANEINDRLLQVVTTEDAGDMNLPTKPDGKSQQEEGLSASVQILPLPAGLFLFSVKSARPSTAASTGALSLPAVHVGLGPGVRADQVEFIDGAGNHGPWLFEQGDLLIAKIKGTGATLVLTSVRAPAGEVLSIKVERLEDRTAEEPVPTAQLVAEADPAPSSYPDMTCRIQVGTHIRSRGDMNFADVAWAGRVAPGLWIESFSVLPMERFQAHDIEYKGLTGSGFETPWLSDNKMCGTKGMSVPLVGFAVRLRPGEEAAGYDCEYSGYFQSGLLVGPLRNGAPCRSTSANDPLEGIQIRIVRRPPVARTAPSEPLQPANSSSAVAGPSFGRYRDEPDEKRSGSVARRKPPRHTRT